MEKYKIVFVHESTTGKIPTSRRETDVIHAYGIIDAIEICRRKYEYKIVVLEASMENQVDFIRTIN